MPQRDEAAREALRGELEALDRNALREAARADRVGSAWLPGADYDRRFRTLISSLHERVHDESGPHHRRPRKERGRQRFVEIVDFGALIEEVRFAADSPLEGAGFEPSVPRERDGPRAIASRRPVAPLAS
jgi:hypothetical protein